MDKIYTGIGSRETPAAILELMIKLGKHLCDLGWRLRSGGADGADAAFYAGALMSERFTTVNAEVYLPWNGMKTNRGKIWHDPTMGIFDGQRYDTWGDAETIAMEVHPAWDRCGPGAKNMHTRNVYQILGWDLQTPTRFVLCWAKPGSEPGEVKGGTATAVRLALRNNVEVINLYTDEGLKRAQDFLKKAA